MSVNIEKNDENIIIHIDKISLISSIILQNTLAWVAKLEWQLGDKKEFYMAEDILLSESFEEYKNITQEVLDFSFKHEEFKDIVFPVSLLVSAKIIVHKDSITPCITLASMIEIHEVRNVISEIKNAFTQENISFLFSDTPLINQVKLKKFIVENYWQDADEDEIWLFQWIESHEKIAIIFEGDFDNQIVTSLLFKNLSINALSVDECIDMVEDMDNSDKDVLFKLSLWERKKWDILPYEFWHASLSVELRLDFVHYITLKNIFPYFWVLQDSLPVLGYDYPDLLLKEENEKIKESFDELLTQITVFAQKISHQEKHLMVYLGTGAHLVRTTFELNPIELVRFLEYDFKENILKEIQVELYKEFKKLSPIFARYIRVGA